LTLGAGAVVPQTLTLIDNAVAGGALAHNQVLRDARSATERVHLVGWCPMAASTPASATSTR